MVAPTHSAFRTPGCARLEVRQVHGCSALTAAYATSPLQLLPVRPRGPSAWVYTSSLGGGFVAGDHTTLDVVLHRGARCLISTQSMTKVYRNSTRVPCQHQTTALLKDNALLVFAPDPVQPFAKSTFEQRQRWRLASSSSLVLLDWYTSGRAGCGESWEFTHFFSRNEVVIDDQPVFIDSIRLGPAEGSVRAHHRTGRFTCFAMLLVLGPALRTISRAILSEVGASPLQVASPMLRAASPIQDGAVLRVAGGSVESVGKELSQHLRALQPLLGDDPWQRKW